MRDARTMQFKIEADSWTTKYSPPLTLLHHDDMLSSLRLLWPKRLLAGRKGAQPHSHGFEHGRKGQTQGRDAYDGYAAEEATPYGCCNAVYYGGACARLPADGAHPGGFKALPNWGEAQGVT